MTWPTTNPWNLASGGWANDRGWSARQPDLTDRFCGAHAAIRTTRQHDLEAFDSVLASLHQPQAAPDGSPD